MRPSKLIGLEQLLPCELRPVTQETTHDMRLIEIVDWAIYPTRLTHASRIAGLTSITQYRIKK
jgi:hypothetical protein